VLTEKDWNTICPCYKDYPIGFQACLPYLLAQLVHHYDWLMATDLSGNNINISASHPILLSRVFTSGTLLRLRSAVIGNVTSGRCEQTGMTATGIPPHIDLARQLEEVKEENRRLRQRLEVHHDEIMTELPKRVTENIIANIQIEGVQQLSRNDLEGIMGTLFERYALRGAAESAANTNASTVATVGAAVDEFRFWTWGGKIRPVPENWSFPKGNVKAICDLFITGLPVLEIRPLRHVRCHDLARSDQSRFTKAEYIYRKICSLSVEMGVVSSINDYRSMTIVAWDTVFAETFPHMISMVEVANGKTLKKAGELSVFTFYDYLKNAEG